MFQFGLEYYYIEELFFLIYQPIVLALQFTFYSVVVYFFFLSPPCEKKRGAELGKIIQFTHLKPTLI